MLNYLAYGWFPGLLTASVSTSSGVLNAANNWCAMGFRLPFARTLTEVSVFLTANTGSPVAADCRLDIFDTASTGLPNTSLSGSVLGANPTSNAWNRWTGLSQAVSAHTQYWCVWKNLNASPAANYITIQRGANQITAPHSSQARWGPAFLASTDGGGTWPTTAPNIATLRLGFNDGSYWGAPFQSVTTGAGAARVYSARKIGNRFTSPASFPLKAYGLVFGLFSKAGTPTVGSQFEVYTGTTLVATTGVVPAGAIQAQGYVDAYFSSPYTFLPNTDYRIVATEPANADAIGNGYNWTYYTVDNDAASKALIPLGWRRTYYDGSSWTETDTDFLPMGILPDPSGQFASSAGGLRLHPGMAGGMRG